MDSPVRGHQGAIHASCGTASGKADSSPATPSCRSGRVLLPWAAFGPPLRQRPNAVSLFVAKSHPPHQADQQRRRWALECAAERSAGRRLPSHRP